MASRAARPPRRPYGRQPPKEPSPPKDEPVKILDDLQEITVNQGQKIEYVAKVAGTKPITVAWVRDNTTKLKSSKNSKIVFTQGQAKLLIMEAEGSDDGEYRLEVSNKFGTDQRTARVNVIVPEKMKGTVKQKDRQSVVGETVELKGFDTKRASTVGGAEGLKRGSLRGSISGGLPGMAGLKRTSKSGADAGAASGAGIPAIVVDGGMSPGGSRRGSTADPNAAKKAGPDDDVDEDTKYFKVKPQNQVVKLGETMYVECTFKVKPPSLNWYRGAISVKTDPRATVTYDPAKLHSSLSLNKCKPTDEAKFKCQVEDEAGEETLELAGFSVFVKDPNDSGLDFRSLLKHKDLKKKRGSKNDPNWGQLNPHEKRKKYRLRLCVDTTALRSWIVH